MSRPQKSTIVRFQHGAAPGAVPRWPTSSRPAWPGASPATSGSRSRPGCRPRRLPEGGEPFEVESLGAAVRGHVWGAGPVVYLVHGWGGRGSQLASFVEPLLAGGFRVVMFDAPAHGDSDPGPAGPGRTHGVEFGKALDAVFARYGPGGGGRRPLARRDLDVPDPAVRLALHPAPGAARADGRGGAALRPVPAGARLRRSHAAGLRPAPGGVRRRPDGGVRRGRSRPRTSTRCPRWWCTTAATARRRTPTRSGSSRRCPTPGW